MEVARISASLKKIGAFAHLDKLALMEADLATRQRKIEELRARTERLDIIYDLPAPTADKVRHPHS